MNSNFWKGKRVLVTGHTGFKGGWLCLSLSQMGAEVYGFSLEPEGQHNLFEAIAVENYVESIIGNINDYDAVLSAVKKSNPDVIFHLAAQPLVRKSYLEPLNTFETNVMGTAKLLEASRQCDVTRAVVCITTDKCYENKEWEWGYRETDRLGGFDPYSNSKACAELLVSSYRNSFLETEGKCSVASARAGNVVGGGDWSKDRLLPDLLDSFARGVKASIRNPMATRPWQHVLEPISGYILLAEKLLEKGGEYSEAWNFGPDEESNKSVHWVADHVASVWGEPAVWVSESHDELHEATFLKLDCSKAKFRLDWFPVWGVDEALERVVKWHKSYSAGGDMLQYSISEIEEYVSAL